MAFNNLEEEMDMSVIMALSESDEDMVQDEEMDGLTEADDFDDLDDVMEDDMLDEGEETTEMDKEDPKDKGDAELAREEADLIGEGFDIYDPIAFSESHVRMHQRGDKYLISESDFESVCFHYLGQKNGYQVLGTIAESHGILTENLVVMLTEGELEEPEVKVNKGRNSKGNVMKGIVGSLKKKISILNKQISNLPPSSPSAKAKKEQRRRLRAQLVLHSND